MPKVRFLSRQEPRTGRLDGDPVYEEGQVYDLRPDQVRRWLNRQVVELVTDEKPKRPEPAPEAVAGPIETAPTDDGDLDDKSRDELLEIAQARGVELPAGYVRKDQLLEALRSGG